MTQVAQTSRSDAKNEKSKPRDEKLRFGPKIGSQLSKAQMRLAQVRRAHL